MLFSSEEKHKRSYKGHSQEKKKKKRGRKEEKVDKQ
jgi:hypothetical protein